MSIFFIQYPAIPAFVGLVAFCLYRMAAHPHDRRRNDLLAAVLALLLPILALIAGVLHVAGLLRPEKLDLIIYRLDGALGFQPAFAMGQLLQWHPWLAISSAVAYGLLPVAVVILFTVYLWLRPEGELAPLVKTMGWNTALAVPIYLLVPVAGPLYQFASFPQLPDVMPTSSLLMAPPNGVPSVHMSTALLILWFCRHWWVGRVVAFAFLCLTVVATLGSGEHYALDLVLAVPYALAVGWLGARRKARVEVEQEAQVLEAA